VSQQGLVGTNGVARLETSLVIYKMSAVVAW